MVIRFSLLLVVLAMPILDASDGSCLRNEDCLVQDGALTTRVNGKTVDNSTFCCTNQSDYIDMTLVAPGNVTCHCTTAAEAAAAYADRTMGEGRACHWGADCEGVEEALAINGSAAYCCLGNEHQYVHVTHFGAEESVCRCYGSKLPTRDPGVYHVPGTNISKSSGESCSYNHDCGDFPSSLCLSSEATFCCYGSRGLETVNDPDSNITRCTCTNDFTGTRCASDPYPVLDPDAEEAECQSGEACQGTSSHFTCSHGDAVFCCPRQGVNLTIVDDVITSCTCVSAGRQCNATYTSSGGSLGPGWSWVTIFISGLVFAVTDVWLL